jgi:hypothetical protein
MDLRFSMFPIAPMVRNWVGVPDGTFDDSLLPFQIVDDVYIEQVSSLIPKDEFDYCKSALGTETMQLLQRLISQGTV